MAMTRLQEHYEKVMFRDSKGMQKTYKPNKILGYGYKDQNFRSIIGAAISRLPALDAARHSATQIRCRVWAFGLT